MYSLEMPHLLLSRTLKDGIALQPIPGSENQ